MDKKKILLVEDQAIIAMQKKMRLDDYGYDVHVVHKGEAAVESVRNTSFDLILMDVDLGSGIDGTDAAEIILRDRDIPILFLSSHTEPEIVERTEMITSYGYVVKGSDITVLDASIKMAFKLFRAKQQLEKTNKILTAVIEQSPVIMVMIMADGTIRYFNEPCADYFKQHNRESVIGKTPDKLDWSWKNYLEDGTFVPPEEVPTARAFRGEVTDREVYKVVLDDGTVRFGLVSAFPIYDENGTILAAFLSVIDITEEKLREK